MGIVRDGTAVGQVGFVPTPGAHDGAGRLRRARTAGAGPAGLPAPPEGLTRQLLAAPARLHAVKRTVIVLAAAGAVAATAVTTAVLAGPDQPAETPPPPATPTASQSAPTPRRPSRRRRAERRSLHAGRRARLADRDPRRPLGLRGPARRRRRLRAGPGGGHLVVLRLRGVPRRRCAGCRARRRDRPRVRRPPRPARLPRRPRGSCVRDPLRGRGRGLPGGAARRHPLDPLRLARPTSARSRRGSCRPTRPTAWPTSAPPGGT